MLVKSTYQLLKVTFCPMDNPAINQNWPIRTKNSKLYPLFCVTRNNYMEVLQKGMLIYKLNVFTDQFWLILKVYQSDFKNGYIFLSFL